MRPALMINEFELQLLTSKRHNEGTNLTMIHVSIYPICHNLSHPDDNRLAPAILGAKPTRVGNFSHTWTLSKSMGGFHVVASTNLHSLKMKSDFLVPNSIQKPKGYVSELVKRGRQISSR